MKMESIPWPRERVASTKTFKLPAGARVISADDHMMEPMDLWQERMSPNDRDRAPRLRRDETGALLLSAEGRSFDMPGWNSHFVEGRQGYWDTDARLVDMDAEGIDVSICFHGRAMALFGMQDKELFVRVMDVYNQHAAEVTKASGGRLIAVGIVPTIYFPERTREYVCNLKAMGIKAIQIPTAPRGVRYNSRQMEPLWDGIEEGGIPLSFHVGGALEWSGLGSLGANVTKGLQPYRSLWAMLVFSGILERHPQLKVVFTEGGAGWVASAIYDADNIYREYVTELKPKLGNLPSHYWRRQCYASFMDDPIALELEHRIGAENMLWSVDYPHPECVFGQVDKVVNQIIDTVGLDKAVKIVGGNAADLWDI